MARASSSSWVLSSLLLLAACAHGTGAERSRSDREAAQRIYLVAEERYSAGDYAEAVELMRHALLQLPSTSDHDHLRHELVLRMAHTELRDHAATGHVAPLHDARQMLERYLQRHEQLFGESTTALAERGDVYELLHLVEQQLEPVTVALAEPPELQSDDVATELDAVASVIMPASTAALAGAERTPELDSAPISTSTSPRRTDEDGDEVREVVVRRPLRLASLDDPRVKGRLSHDYSTGWLGGVLTAWGMTTMRDERALVRGSSQLAGDGDFAQKQLARRAGQSLLEEAREELRDCYTSAHARQPIDLLVSQVEASIDPDGSISQVRIVEGGLIDGYGDACLIEALEGTSLPPLEGAAEPVRVQVALQFLYEGLLYFNEGSGEQVHKGGRGLSACRPRLSGLPDIEESVPLIPEVPRPPRLRDRQSARDKPIPR